VYCDAGRSIQIQDERLEQDWTSADDYYGTTIYNIRFDNAATVYKSVLKVLPDADAWGDNNEEMYHAVGFQVTRLRFPRGGSRRQEGGGFAAAVQREGRAADVGRPGRGQVEARVGDVLRGGHPAQRDACGDGSHGAGLAVVPDGRFGRYESRHGRIHPYLGCPFDGQAGDQVMQARFRRPRRRRCRETAGCRSRCRS
jgi:hypothetical protein